MRIHYTASLVTRLCMTLIVTYLDAWTFRISNSFSTYEVERFDWPRTYGTIISQTQCVRTQFCRSVFRQNKTSYQIIHVKVSESQHLDDVPWYVKVCYRIIKKKKLAAFVFNQSVVPVDSIFAVWCLLFSPAVLGCRYICRLYMTFDCLLRDDIVL